MLKFGPGEIGRSHSHQSVLIRHLAESAALVSLRVLVLSETVYPSGQAYHENKPLVNRIISRTERPAVFHMCWTDNRENKVIFLREMGLWFLKEESHKQQQCSSADQLAALLGEEKGGGSARADTRVLDLCCARDKYWPPPPPFP